MTKEEALRMALEALEIVTREMLTLRDELAERGGRPTKGIHQLLWDSSHKVYTDTAIPTATAIREVLAQPERPAVQGEPVAWMYHDRETGWVIVQKEMRGFVDHTKTTETPLYTTPQPAVPERKPLTNEEICNVAEQCGCMSSDWIDFARAIEQAHGIKD